MELLKFTPILIMTLAMIIVSFMPTKGQKKIMAVMVTFILWLATFGITWVAFWRN